MGVSPQQARTTSGSLPSSLLAQPPDADPLGAMDGGGFHGQPLGHRTLARDDDVHVVLAAQAVVEDRQQAVCVGRQVHPDDVGFLVDDMIEEAGILVGEPVVVLLPDVRSE